MIDRDRLALTIVRELYGFAPTTPSDEVIRSFENYRLVLDGIEQYLTKEEE